MQYRSKFEERVHQQIPQASYESTKIPFVEPAKKRTYTPDFQLPNGILLETKGILDLDARQKALWVREQHPHLDIRFVFQRDQAIRKGSKTKYSDWCKKHGFLYAIGAVPAEWLV